MPVTVGVLRNIGYVWMELRSGYHSVAGVPPVAWDSVLIRATLTSAPIPADPRLGLGEKGTGEKHRFPKGWVSPCSGARALVRLPWGSRPKRPALVVIVCRPMRVGNSSGKWPGAGR